MDSEELGKSPVIKMAGSDGHTYETTADDAHNMALAAREEGVQLKAFIKTKDAEGNRLILYSCFKLEAEKVRLDIAGIPADAPVRVSVLDEEHNMEPVEFTRSGSVIEIAKAPGSAVFQIEIPKSEIQ